MSVPSLHGVVKGLPEHLLATTSRLESELLAGGDSCNVAYWSIVFGLVEQYCTDRGSTCPEDTSLFGLADQIYEQFRAFCQGIAVGSHDTGTEQRACIKVVAEAVWKAIGRSSKENILHAQSVHSFIEGKALDCFGVTLTTLCVLMELGVTTLNLTLSEDHAYISFMDGSKRATADVATTVKKDRGNPVQPAKGNLPCWAYMHQQPVVCSTAPVALAAAAANINSTIGGKEDGEEDDSLVAFKREVLRSLNKLGALESFPYGLIELAAVETHCPAPPTPVDELTLLNKAVDINEGLYNGAQVFPGLYFGHYYVKQGLIADAMKWYAKAAHTMAGYERDVQLIKIFTSVSEKIFDEVQDLKEEEGPEAMTLELLNSLVSVYDAFLLWEERNNKLILTGKIIQTFLQALAEFSAAVRASYSPQGQGVSQRMLEGTLVVAFHKESINTAEIKRCFESLPVSKRRKRSQKRYNLDDI